MRKRFLAFMLILSFSFIHLGCWNAREIDELAFVIGIGLDKTRGGNIKVTVQIAKPSVSGKSPTGGGKDEKSYIVESSEGKTIFEAIRNLAKVSSRRIFWAHNKVIIIGEDYARSGISEILDFFCRNPELRLRTWVAVTPGEAESLLNKSTEMENDPATFIGNLMEQRNWTGKGYGSMLKDFLEDYLSSATYPVAARIVAAVDSSSSKMELTGSAVFGKEKMVGWLGEKETRGLLWLQGKLKSSIMVVSCPMDGKPLSIEIIGQKVSYKTRITDSTTYITVNVTAAGNFSEQACGIDFTNMDNLGKVEEALAAEIKSEIEAVTKTAQNKVGLDFVGFNHQLHLQHKGEWNKVKHNWPKLFKEAKISINVEANIPRQTLFAKPLTSGKQGE